MRIRKATMVVVNALQLGVHEVDFVDLYSRLEVKKERKTLIEYPKEVKLNP